jgi:hypothetical protein
MGFTPAAWDRWPLYNTLGKGILTLFLFICHFLVVTILITVLTNSFMAIVQNANEEHQFVFAVNTISNVKSDALFSYVAPTNIVQWLLTPLRYFVPFRQYVKVNRTIIKITHFPVLFTIYLYERTALRSAVYDDIDLVEFRGRARKPFAPRLPRLVREPSIATFRQDRALEEVFKQPAGSTMRKTQQSHERRQTSTVVNNWMRNIDDGAGSNAPEQDNRTIDKTDRRRYLRPGPARTRNFSRQAISIASDPEEFMTNADLLSPHRSPFQITSSQLDAPSRHTDADGDDELPSDDNDDDDVMTLDHVSQPMGPTNALRPSNTQPADYFNLTASAQDRVLETLEPEALLVEVEGDVGNVTPSRASAEQQIPRHLRNVSSATMIYKPEKSPPETSEPTIAGPATQTRTAPTSGTGSPIHKSASSGAGGRTPKRALRGPARMRPILPTKEEAAFRSMPNFGGMMPAKQAGRQVPPTRTALEMDLVSDIGDNKAIGGGYVGAIPASFATQLFNASATARHSQEQKDEQERFSRLMMARMNSLEEGFREVIHEMRETMGGISRGSRNQSPQRIPRPAQREKRGKDREREKPTANVGVVMDTGDKENLEPKEPSATQGPQTDGSVTSTGDVSIGRSLAGSK